MEMTGKKIGLLTVLHRVENDRFGRMRWRCRCDCGNEVDVVGQHLRSGNTKACGCLNAAVNITGQRFNRLVALREERKTKGRSYWAFRCDCGNVVIARKTHVTAGATTSCGCFQKERTIKRFTTHGMTGSPEYNSWASMLERCNNPKHQQYKDYGGRGITVCYRWRKFANFYADMGARPEGMTLDRIDNSKGYEPGNCRWATWLEQQAPGRRRSSHAPSA